MRPDIIIISYTATDLLEEPLALLILGGLAEGVGCVIVQRSVTRGVEDGLV